MTEVDQMNPSPGPHAAAASDWNRIADQVAPWGLLALRLVIGYGFMAHGVAKIIKGPDAFVGILGALDVPLPFLMAWLTILIELIGGAAFIVGAFVPLMSVPMIVILLVATMTVHLQYGFSSIKLMAVTAAGAKFGPPGYETDLLYIAGIAVLVFSGPGPWSVDGWIKQGRNGTRQLRR